MTESTAVDRAALAALYQRYGRLVHRRAARILSDEQLAHDVCHDVFVQILRTTPWTPPSPLAWLYVTTTNLCLNLLRSDRRRRRALAQRAALGRAGGQLHALDLRVPGCERQTFWIVKVKP